MNIWPFRKSKIIKLRKPRVTFVGEQDGPPEKTLKQTLIDIFGLRDDIWQAYLARVSYDTENSSASVALCLLGKEDMALVEDVSKAFKVQFGKGCFLDIIFISEEQKAELDSVCHAFYSKENN